MKYALTEGAKRVGGGVNLGHSLSPPSHFMLATGLRVGTVEVIRNLTKVIVFCSRPLKKTKLGIFAS